jgi:hypothetical protein
MLSVGKMLRRKSNAKVRDRERERVRQIGEAA